MSILLADEPRVERMQNFYKEIGDKKAFFDKHRINPLAYLWTRTSAMLAAEENNSSRISGCDLRVASKFKVPLVLDSGGASFPFLMRCIT